MSKPIATFKTDGRGLWSNTIRKISILDIEEVGRELRVYFDPNQWDIKKQGLIYTDNTFLACLKGYLKGSGKSYWEKIDYSENGMQGDDYVSFDIPRK